MIVGITIQNFKAIHEINLLPMSRFHVLVGPNGSGKSTFLDAIDFVRDCLDVGPMKAVEKRNVPNFNDLTFMRKGGIIVIEMWLDIGDVLPSQEKCLFNYRIAIKQDDRLGVCVHEEMLTKFMMSGAPAGKTKPKRLLGKTGKSADFYQREDGKYQDSFVFGMDKLTLSLTPPDEKRYPTANAIKRFLMQGIRYIQLNSRAMQLPCPATRGTDLELDGTNLARVVGRLSGKSGSRAGKILFKMSNAIERWTDHLRYALPELQEIGWGRRDADNAEYIVLKYDNGLECPSWLISDGTLRMLALTLPAFLPASPGIYMVEEPENGVHPKALEIILRSLSTIPQSQMLVATHSPLVVQQVGLKPLLCFSKVNGATHIVPGSEQPILKNWDGSPDLATIFSSGVLE